MAVGLRPAARRVKSLPAGVRLSETLARLIVPVLVTGTPGRKPLLIPGSWLIAVEPEEAMLRCVDQQELRRYF